ncbi:unnamed protein product, partial [Iphiclides podalirius]
MQIFNVVGARATQQLRLLLIHGSRVRHVGQGDQHCGAAIGRPKGAVVERKLVWKFGGRSERRAAAGRAGQGTAGQRRVASAARALGVGGECSVRGEARPRTEVATASDACTVTMDVWSGPPAACVRAPPQLSPAPPTADFAVAFFPAAGARPHRAQGASPTQPPPHPHRARSSHVSTANDNKHTRTATPLSLASLHRCIPAFYGNKEQGAR